MINKLKLSIAGGAAALLMGVSMSASANLAGTWNLAELNNLTQGPTATATDNGAGAVGLKSLATPTNGLIPLGGSIRKTLEYTSTAAAAGTVSFSWAANYTYEGDANMGYLLNGVETALFQHSLFDFITNDLGSASFGVASGDSFGFYIYSGDSLDGFAELDISEFNARETQAIPEPGSLALLGLGLLGLAAMRKRKSA